MPVRPDPWSSVQQHARHAHEALGTSGTSPADTDERPSALASLRRVVADSWARSLAALPLPTSAAARIVLSDRALRDHREAHPLAVVMPVIRRLLVEPCSETGLLVAVGDADGRLLWVEGDRAARRRAEGMLFTDGADWSEGTVGTSAPGTALILQRGVQIAGAEHFSPAVQDWSCTAVPIHDPATRRVIGVVDLTGREEAVAPHSMALVQAAVAAAEAELRLARLRAAAGRRTTSRTSPSVRRPGAAASSGGDLTMGLLGRDTGTLTSDDRFVELSLRHSELLAMLATHPRGLSVNELADLINPDVTPTTLRAEMVRLRRVLEAVAPALVPESRPYRLPAALPLDAVKVLDHLDRGAHRQALDLYVGAVLPASEAPGVIRLRHRVSTALREAVLGDGSVDTLLRYLALEEAADDRDAWFAALRRLPAKSPKRAAVVAQLERLDAEAD